MSTACSSTDRPHREDGLVCDWQRANRDTGPSLLCGVVKPFSAADAEIHALRAVCTRLARAGESVPSPDTLARVLNLAAEFSTNVYEGQHTPGAFRLLAHDAHDSQVTIRLREVRLPQLRMIVAASGGGDVVMRENESQPSIIGIDPPQYVAVHAGVRFSFSTRQCVYVSTHGLIIASCHVGHGLELFDEARLPSPDSALAPAKLSPALRHDRLLELVQAIRVHGHGGTIVFCPRGELTGCEALAGEMEPWRFASNHAVQLDDAQMKPAHMKQSLERRLEAELRSIGQLTRADGAVVVNPSLELLGFGQRLIGEPPTTLPILKSAVHDRSDVSYPSGGTRLASAINYVNSQPDTVVLCVSSDGPVRLVWAEDRQVHLREHLEAFL